MKCPLCKGTMQKGKTSMPYETGKDRLIVVKDVPALICEQCGESYFEEKEVDAIEELIHSIEQKTQALFASG